MMKIYPDWWLKSLTGSVLGLIFSILIGNLISIMAFNLGVHSELIPQFAMWTIPWIWMISFFMVYFIPSGWQALILYSVLDLLLYGLLKIL